MIYDDQIYQTVIFICLLYCATIRSLITSRSRDSFFTLNAQVINHAYCVIQMRVRATAGETSTY